MSSLLDLNDTGPAIDVEAWTDSMLRRGWRVIIKSHMISRSYLEDPYGPPEGGVDPTNWMGWCVDAYPYGPKPPATQKVWGRTAPTMRQAIRSTEEQIRELTSS